MRCRRRSSPHVCPYGPHEEPRGSHGDGFWFPSPIACSPRPAMTLPLTCASAEPRSSIILRGYDKLPAHATPEMSNQKSPRHGQAKVAQPKQRGGAYVGGAPPQQLCLAAFSPCRSAGDVTARCVASLRWRASRPARTHSRRVGCHTKNSFQANKVGKPTTTDGARPCKSCCSSPLLPRRLCTCRDGPVVVAILAQDDGFKRQSTRERASSPFPDAFLQPR